MIALARNDSETGDQSSASVSIAAERAETGRTAIATRDADETGPVAAVTTTAVPLVQDHERPSRRGRAPRIEFVIATATADRVALGLAARSHRPGTSSSPTRTGDLLVGEWCVDDIGRSGDLETDICRCFADAACAARGLAFVMYLLRQLASSGLLRRRLRTRRSTHRDFEQRRGVDCASPCRPIDEQDEIVMSLERRRIADRPTRSAALEQPDRPLRGAPPGADHGRGHRPARRSEGGCMKPDETAFEAEIEAWLLDHGYAKGDPRSVRPRARARSRRAARVRRGDAARRVGAADRSSTAARTRRAAGLLKRVAAELDERGTVDVLRHGVKDLGVDVRLDVPPARARARAGARRRLRREPALGRAAAALRRLDERDRPGAARERRSRSRRPS